MAASNISVVHATDFGSSLWKSRNVRRVEEAPGPDNAARYEYPSIQLAVFTRGKTIHEDHVRNRKGREHPDNCALRAPLSIDSRIKRQLIIPFLLMDLLSASSAFLKARVPAIPLEYSSPSNDRDVYSI